MDAVAIYSRVLTSDQDASRQLHELRDFAEREYPDAEIVEFIDIISGMTADEARKYQTLRLEIAADGVDVVVVDEISRLSRLDGGEIYDFIQHTLEYDTSVRDHEVGLSIDIAGGGGGVADVEQTARTAVGDGGDGATRCLADIVVSNADYAHTEQELLPERKRRYSADY